MPSESNPHHTPHWNNPPSGWLLLSSAEDIAVWCAHLLRTRPAKQEGKGVRILPFFLPTKSPWLNPIEPKWVHGKRHIVEHDSLLSARQLAQRVCDHFHCSYLDHFSLPEKVS